MNELMLREIESQPDYAEACIDDIRKSAAAVSRNCNRIIMGGCGDSLFSAVALSCLPEAQQINFQSASAQEIEQTLDLSSSDLVVLSSVSGSTKRTIDAAEKALRSGAKTVAVTCNENSELAKKCDQLLLLPYQPITRKTPHSLDYTMGLLAGLLLIEHLSDKSIQQADEIAGALRNHLLTVFDECEPFTESITADTQFWFLGSGNNLGTAMYGAAKFHEAGGLSAFYGETENFWHGMNFMVKPGDRVVLFQNLKEDRSAEQLLLDNFKKLSNPVLCVGPTKADTAFRVKTGSDNEILEPFLNAVTCQALCYKAANRLGLQVDQPETNNRNNKVHLAAQSGWFKR